MLDLFGLALVFSTIRLSTPLILAALGGMFSERSGVINIALEGMMLAGAFTAAAVTYSTGSPWVGLLAAVIAGVLIALVHAVACIRYKADQVVVGTAINSLMVGLPGFLSGAFFLSSGSTPQIPIENLIPRVPIVLAFGFVPLSWYVLYRTPFGLRLRAVGENPEAAEFVSVVRVLEDESYHSADHWQVLAREALASHTHFSMSTEDSVQVQHQRGLARAVWPHQRDLIPLAHLERHTAQRGAAVMVGKMQIVNL